MIFNKLHAATWGDVGKVKEKGFLILIYSLGWHGLGKLHHSLSLSLFV